MFILLETENSDVKCGSTTTLFGSMEKAQEIMKERYDKTIEIFGGEFDSEERENLCPENQRWAHISDGAAHVQVGIDNWSWEISEDPDWVKADTTKGFIVTGAKTEEESGDLLLIQPVFAATEEDAKRILKEMYLKALQETGLEDNGARDCDGDPASGGKLLEDKAELWDYAEYASYSLVNVVTLAIHVL